MHLAPINDVFFPSVCAGEIKKKISENRGKSRKILPNRGKSRKIEQNLTKSRKILPNRGKSSQSKLTKLTIFQEHFSKNGSKVAGKSYFLFVKNSQTSRRIFQFLTFWNTMLVQLFCFFSIKTTVFWLSTKYRERYYRDRLKRSYHRD